MPVHNVDILVCGAISNLYARMIEGQGIELIAFISGNFRDVFNAYLNGTIMVNYSMLRL